MAALLPSTAQNIGRLWWVLCVATAPILAHNRKNLLAGSGRSLKGAFQVTEGSYARDVGHGALFRSTEISHAARSQPAEQRMLVACPLDLAAVVSAPKHGDH